MISGNVNQSESGIHYLTTKQVARPRKLFPGWTIVLLKNDAFLYC